MQQAYKATLNYSRASGKASTCFLVWVGPGEEPEAVALSLVDKAAPDAIAHARVEVSVERTPEHDGNVLPYDWD